MADKKKNQPNEKSKIVRIDSLKEKLKKTKITINVMELLLAIIPTLYDILDDIHYSDTKDIILYSLLYLVKNMFCIKLAEKVLKLIIRTVFIEKNIDELEIQDDDDEIIEKEERGK